MGKSLEPNAKKTTLVQLLRISFAFPLQMEVYAGVFSVIVTYNSFQG